MVVRFGLSFLLGGQYESYCFACGALGPRHPMAAAKPATSKIRPGLANPAASETPPEQGHVVDMLAAENSKLDAKLKTICRKSGEP
jgi:hypothetical protein